MSEADGMRDGAGGGRSIPSVAALTDLIAASGSGSTEYFGYALLPDGLYLQQEPEEFAEFVHYMASHVAPSVYSLDIGIASGGQTKFLRDYYKCQKTIVVDLGEHPDAVHWNRIKKDLDSDLILEIIDDSHKPEVREALLRFRGQIDFAHVDGDHSYEGLRKDIFLVRELMKPGAIMVLHDTHAVHDCKRVYAELLESRVFEHVCSFHRRFGISVWRLRAPLASTRENRDDGIGDL